MLKVVLQCHRPGDDLAVVVAGQHEDELADRQVVFQSERRHDRRLTDEERQSWFFHARMRVHRRRWRPDVARLLV